CRTAALGGHIEECDSCRQRAISYNSCLNRHCPKCQAAARQRWLENRSAELLPVPYFHVVFTLPHLLALIQHIRPHYFPPFTTQGFGHSDLFLSFFRTHNSTTPFKTHNSYWRLPSTGSIASVQARSCWRWQNK